MGEVCLFARTLGRFALASFTFSLLLGVPLELIALPRRRLEAPRRPPGRWRLKVETLVAHLRSLPIAGRLDVQEPDVLRMPLNELFSRFYLITHQILECLEREQLILLIQGDLEKRAL